MASIADRPVGIYELGASGFLASTTKGFSSFFYSGAAILADSSTAAVGYFSVSTFSYWASSCAGADSFAYFDFYYSSYIAVAWARASCSACSTWMSLCSSARILAASASA